MPAQSEARPLRAARTEYTGERIRVLRIARASLSPSLRGRERAIAKRFPQVDLRVLAAKSWQEAGVDVAVQADDLFPVKGVGTFLSKHIQAFAYNPLPIIKVMLEHRPHIIDLDHEPYSVPAAEVITLRNLFAPKAKIVMQTAQNILKRYPAPFRQMEQRAFRQVDGAYMCSETVREVLDIKGFDKPQTLAPFGVDLDLFKPKPIRLQDGMPFTIGYLGRLLPEKGLLTIADALSQIRSTNWRFMVVGDGPERGPLEAALKQYGLLHKTVFTGAVPYERTPEYLHWMDALIIPTRTTGTIREQFGRVIIEAMACGVPVIGSTCGAIPEVIGHAGMVFQEEDDEELADIIDRVIDDEILRRRLIRDGRERVENNFTWEHAAERIFGLYLRVLGLDGLAGK